MSIERRGNNIWRITIELGYGANRERLRERKENIIDDPVLLQSVNKLDEYDLTILKSSKKLKDFLEAKENPALFKHAKKLLQYFDEETLKFKIEVENGAYISPNKLKFEPFIEEWARLYGSNPKNLSPATFKNYMKVIHVRFIPAFGHLRVDQITTMMLANFLKNLEKPGMRQPLNTNKPLTEKQKERLMKPLDSETIGYTYRVLRNIFSRAEEWKIVKSNPMDGVKKPAAKDAKEKMLAQRANPQFYDESEAQTIVDALYKESIKWRLLILGSMIGGCRRGELLGFEWPNVKQDEGVITVENNIPLTENGQAVEKGPKSIASYRDIDMPDWFMLELKTYREQWIHERKRLGSTWKGGDREFVFHNGTGAPYYYQHPSKWWKRFCTRHNIRYVKFHGLRHSSGTLLLEDEDESNFDSILMAIQKRLGHSRLSTTSDIYVHVTKKVKKKTAGKFDKFARKTEDISGTTGDRLGTNTVLRRVK